MKPKSLGHYVTALGYIGSGQNQISGDERKKKLKWVSQENDKTTRNQTIQQKSNQRDKHQGCSPCKILGTILEMDEKRTLTNGPEKNKTNDDA